MFHEVTSRSVDGMLVLLSTVSYKKKKKSYYKENFRFSYPLLFFRFFDKSRASLQAFKDL